MNMDEGQYWTPVTVTQDLVEMAAGVHRVTLYAPDWQHAGGYLDIDRQLHTGTVRSLYSGAWDRAVQDTHPQRRAGQAARTLQAQWSGQGVAALVHAVLGTCSPWCGAPCPIRTLHRAAQQAQP